MEKKSKQKNLEFVTKPKIAEFILRKFVNNEVWLLRKLQIFKHSSVFPSYVNV